MSETLTKWGNGLAAPIPADLAAALQWTEHTTVTYTLLNGALIITPAPSPTLDLATLIAEITPDNRHDEISTGSAVGHEVW